MKLFDKIAAKMFAMILLVGLILPAVGGLNIPMMIPPSVSISADYDRTTTTAEINVVAVDVIDNAGMAWIKLYENSNLIAEKTCSGTVCYLAHVEVKTSASGTYTYTAVAADVDGKMATAEVDVTFAGVDHEAPQYSNIAATPVSPAPYGTHRFSVDWTDNGRIENVQVEHDFFGTVFAADATAGSGNTYYYDIQFIELGNYNWRMVAEDTAEQGPNTNTTPWQAYEVVKATPTVTWSATPDWAVDYGTETSVSCALGEAINDESQVELSRNGGSVPNPDTVTMDAGTHVYVCSANETAHYNAVSYTQNLTVNQLPSDATLTLNGANIDLPGVERLTDTVDMIGTLMAGENGIELYIDGVNVINGTPSLNYATGFNLSGNYNITLVAPETINYARFETTLWATVVDTVNPNPVTGLTPGAVGEGFINISWTNPADDDLAGVSIYVDGALVENVTVENYTISNLLYNTQYNITLNTFDNDGNMGADAAILQSTSADTTLPAGTVVAGDVNFTYAPGYSFALEVQWGDTFALDQVWFEHDFTGATITQPADGNNSNVYFLNVSDLGAGIYQWQGHANDTSGNEGLTGLVTFEVYKADGSVNLMLNSSNSDMTVFEGDDVNITAELVAGEGDIDVLENGISLYLGPAPYTNVRNYPLAGTYNITVDYAATQNYTAASGTLFVNVVDIFPPGSVSVLAVTASGNDWIEWTWANPADADFNESIIYLNGANVANTSSTIYNATGLVPESTNTITIHTKDNAGNVNDTDVNSTFVLPDLTNPVITVLAQPSDRPYDVATVDQFLVNVTDNRVVDTVQFEMDGVNQTVAANPQGLYELNLTGFDAAQHFFRWHANDTESNSASSPLENYTISKLASGVSLTLNGAKQNITSVGPITGVNVTAEKLAGEGTIEVFENSVSLYSGNGPYTALRDYNVIANYNITVVHAETQNYSRSEETYWVFVQPVIRNVSLSYPGNQVIPNDANGTYAITVTNTGNVVDNFTLSITAFDSDVAALNQTAVVDIAPSASVNVELEVGDTTYGLYSADVHAESDNDASANFDLNIQTTVAAYSTVIDSTILGVYYANTQTTSIAQLYEAHVEGSTVTHVDTDINSSTVHSSTIDNSYILSSSQINSSTVTNSILTNCIVINSVLDSIIASNCYVEDSYGDPSDLTGSTVTGGSNIINSTFTNSNGDNAQVTDSFVDNTNATSATIDSSTVDNSNVVNGAVIDSSTVDSSTVDSSTLINGAVVTGGSTVTNSTVDNANIDNSTIINSDVPDGTTVDDAVIQDGVIMNGTVDGTTYTSPKNLTDAINYPPVAGISASSTSITAGQSVTFTSTSTDANIGTELNDSIASYDWSVGGTSFGTNSSASYTFSSTGTYNVILTVQDSFGASDNETVTISVGSAPSSGRSSSGSSSHRSSGPRVLDLISLQPGTFVTIDLYETDVVKFSFDGTQYFISIKDVSLAPKQVDMHIEPVSVDFVAEEYKTENINLNGDMLNDISVKVDQYTSNSGAKFTFGMKQPPAYDAIYVPEEAEPEPEDNETEEELEEDEDDTTGPTGGVVVDADDEEGPGLWTRFVSWLKRLFSSEDDAEELVEEEPLDEPEEEAEEEQKPGLWSRFVSWAISSPEAEAAEGEEAEGSMPSALLGWSLAFLTLALGITLYFVVRKSVIEKRLEKYM